LLQACDSPGHGKFTGPETPRRQVLPPCRAAVPPARRKATRRYPRLAPRGSKDALAITMWATAQRPKCLNCETPPQPVGCEANSQLRGGATGLPLFVAPEVLCQPRLADAMRRRTNGTGSPASRVTNPLEPNGTSRLYQGMGSAPHGFSRLPLTALTYCAGGSPFLLRKGLRN
jgi:hypothetical protein